MPNYAGPERDYTPPCLSVLNPPSRCVIKMAPYKCARRSSDDRGGGARWAPPYYHVH